MKTPLVENGKKPDEFMSATLLLPLPSSTPFGNMALKHMKIVARLDHVNRKLQFVYQDWNEAVSSDFDPFHNPAAHLLYIEEITYFLRVTMDETISLAYLVYMFRKNGEYPKEIKIGSIGSLLNTRNQIASDIKEFGDIFSAFFDWLDLFNKVTNAYKHSFINSDQTVTGQDEPCVPVLNIHHNNLENGVKFYNLSLAEVIRKFNEFYNEAFLYIKKNAEPHLRPDAGD
ncbi:MAG: hypothetical protein KAJ29_00875 [Alphaproteobacteria bacterium]|nr:hypothetical protein [Alphaproteobacteria bacterium]